jgi:predicted dehydrogenase
VLCEKPLAESVSSGQKIAAAAAKSSANFMICFNRRYRPDSHWLKRAIDTGLLGQIYQVKVGWLRETGIPAGTGWFASKQVAGGGPLIDLGVHMLDLGMWLLDYPAPVTVSGDVQANFGPRGEKTWAEDGAKPGPFEVEDSASAFIRLDNGINLYLETCWASHARPGMDDFFVTVKGTKGTVELYVPNYGYENTLTLYTEINGAPVTVKPGVVGQRVDHFKAVADFVDCIRRDLPPAASAEDGLTIMKMIEAIYHSAANQREVVLA